MEEHVIVDSSFSAIINARLEQIDIPSWCFSLPDDEYQGCSPAHFAAGSTTARDGRRMSINVEVIGGTPMVQHNVEQVADRHHLVLAVSLWPPECTGPTSADADYTIRPEPAETLKQLRILTNGQEQFTPEYKTERRIRCHFKVTTF